MEVVVDALRDDVAFSWVLVHLGLRGNPRAADDPPSDTTVRAAFAALAVLVERGLGSVGRLELIDDGRRGRRAPTRHVAEPAIRVQKRVLDACRVSGRAGRAWEWSCWYVNSSDGDTAARHALEGKESAGYYLRRAVT